MGEQGQWTSLERGNWSFLLQLNDIFSLNVLGGLYLRVRGWVRDSRIGEGLGLRKGSRDVLG